MAPLPYRPEHVRDAIARTSHLTNEELGAWQRLTWALWEAEGFLPEDGPTLARLARAGKRWGSLWPAIRNLFTVADGLISCPLLLRSLYDATRRHEAAVKKGERSAGLRKWQQTGSLSPAKPLIPLRGGGSSAQAQLEQSKAKKKERLGEGRIGTAATETAAGEAIELVARQGGIRGLAAEVEVRRWAREHGSVSRVLEIVRAAAAENLQGDHFLRLVRQRVAADRRERELGLPLPFGPSPVGGSGA